MYSAIVACAVIALLTWQAQADCNCKSISAGPYCGFSEFLTGDTCNPDTLYTCVPSNDSPLTAVASATLVCGAGCHVIEGDVNQCRKPNEDIVAEEEKSLRPAAFGVNQEEPGQFSAGERDPYYGHQVELEQIVPEEGDAFSVGDPEELESASFSAGDDELQEDSSASKGGSASSDSSKSAKSRRRRLRSRRRDEQAAVETAGFSMDGSEELEQASFSAGDDELQEDSSASKDGSASDSSRSAKGRRRPFRPPRRNRDEQAPAETAGFGVDGGEEDINPAQFSASEGELYYGHQLELEEPIPEQPSAMDPEVMEYQDGESVQKREIISEGFIIQEEKESEPESTPEQEEGAVPEESEGTAGEEISAGDIEPELVQIIEDNEEDVETASESEDSAATDPEDDGETPAEEEVDEGKRSFEDAAEQLEEPASFSEYSPDSEEPSSFSVGNEEPGAGSSSNSKDASSSDSSKSAKSSRRRSSRGKAKKGNGRSIWGRTNNSTKQWIENLKKEYSSGQISWNVQGERRRNSKGRLSWGEFRQNDTRVRNARCQPARRSRVCSTDTADLWFYFSFTRRCQLIKNSCKSSNNAGFTTSQECMRTCRRAPKPKQEEEKKPAALSDSPDGTSYSDFISDDETQSLSSYSSEISQQPEEVSSFSDALEEVPPPEEEEEESSYSVIPEETSSFSEAGGAEEAPSSKTESSPDSARPSKEKKRRTWFRRSKNTNGTSSRRGKSGGGKSIWAKASTSSKNWVENLKKAYLAGEVSWNLKGEKGSSSGRVSWGDRSKIQRGSRSWRRGPARRGRLTATVEPTTTTTIPPTVI